MKTEISRIVKKWYASNSLSGAVDRVYIFGSLINDEGELFWPSGLKTSDIDLLVRIDPALVNAEQRTKALIRLAGCVSDLESQIAKKLGRDSGWEGNLLSVLPVTWYEIYHCIHKGFDPKIFTLNIFWDVLEERVLEEGLTDFIDKTYQFDNTEVFAAMRLTQRLRNDALKIVEADFGIESFNEQGAVPKEFMRSAALLKFAEVGASKPDARTNLAMGEEYIEKLLGQVSGRNEAIEELFQLVKKRRNTMIYSKPALKPEHLLLLAEVLFDQARYLALPSARETIDRLLRQRDGKVVYG